MILNDRTLQPLDLFPASFVQMRYLKSLWHVLSLILNLHFDILQELTKVVDLRLDKNWLIEVAFSGKLL